MKTIDLPSEKLTISFIIHNDFSHIDTALDSLYKTTKTPFQVCVTINSGQVSQIETLRTKYPSINLTINDAPIGFAANHNAIMCLAQTSFVALINDDVTFHPQTLDMLVDYLQSHDDVGLVGPAVENPDGTLQLSTFSDPTLLRMLYHISGIGKFTKHGGFVRRFLQRSGITRLIGVESLNSSMITRDVPVVVGVCMVVRRYAYEQAGLMDENTLVYGEESGWHWRLRQHGWRVVFVPSARITHHNLTQDLSGWKLSEHRKSMLAYFLMYRAAWQSAIIRLSIVLFHGLAFIMIMPFDRQRASSHWQAVKMGATWMIE